MSVAVYVILKYSYPAEPHTDEAIHCHDFWQLVAVESGFGSIYLEDSVKPLYQGELLLIPPRVTHCVFTSGELKTLECKFALDSEFTEFAEYSALKFIKTDEELREMLRGVEMEAKLNRHLSDRIVELKLAELILLLARRQESKPTLAHTVTAVNKQPRQLAFDVASANDFTRRSNQPPEDELAQLIKSYIDRDLSSNFELRELAESMFISSSQLYRRFVAAYGISPQKYRQSKRIELAKHLLETTDLSITEISERTGFNGIHYFSRCFTAFVNVSPNKYKSSYKSGFVRAFTRKSE